MDRVRFGRALGYGARHAAKTLAAAADAASSPDPRHSALRQNPGAASVSAGSTAGGQNTHPAAARSAAANMAAAASAVRRSAPQARAGARGFGRSVWAPLARFSGVLWLEVTGTFFAVIAAFVGSGAWKLRGAVHAPVSSTEAHKLYLHVAIFAMFTWFALSSFLRARRRGRR